MPGETSLTAAWAWRLSSTTTSGLDARPGDGGERSAGDLHDVGADHFAGADQLHVAVRLQGADGDGDAAIAVEFARLFAFTEEARRFLLAMDVRV